MSGLQSEMNVLSNSSRTREDIIATMQVRCHLSCPAVSSACALSAQPWGHRLPLQHPRS